MSLTAIAALLTALGAVLVVAATWAVFRHEDRIQAVVEDALAQGERPASLYPIVHAEACMGSGACVAACPEHVLARAGGVTHVVEPGSCVGHGRCMAACPVDAIALVFGTARRGVDIPLLGPGYESNRPGVFVVGELGGMGLIRNAIRQGLALGEVLPRALARSAAAPAPPGAVDVAIVGGGPAGIATALACAEAGLSYVLLEQDTVGGSVAHYPRRKVVLSEPLTLPRAGRVGRREMFKEELIAEFERILLVGGIEPREGVRVTGLCGALGAFSLEAEVAGDGTEQIAARTVVLAIGRRGTPRRLEVQGEDLPHVVYRLIDPEQYRGRRVLCVGGGDSAVEAAVAVAEVEGTTVHLSYRGPAIARAKRKNREAVAEAVERGRLRLLLETEVQAIARRAVALRRKDGRTFTVAADDVIVSVGGVLPTPFLESIGVDVETKRGEVAITPRHGPFARERGGEEGDA